MVVVVIVLVRMRVPVVVSAMMAMMSVPEYREPNEIDKKAQHANDEKLIQSAELGTVPEAMECFKQHLEANEDKKDAVSETRERIDLPKSVWEAL